MAQRLFTQPEKNTLQEPEQIAC